MAKRVKKELTTSQKQRRYKVIEKTSYYGEYASIGAPYIVMGAVNFNDWFKTDSGWKVALGGALALALMSIAVLAITSEKAKKSENGGFIKLLLWWLAIAFIFLLLREIMDQIAKIMFFGAIGIAGALGLDVTSKKYSKLAEKYKVAKEEVEKDSIKEEVKEEVKEGKVRF